MHFNLQLKEVKCVVTDDTDVLVLLHGAPEHSKYIIFLSEVGKHLSIGKLMTLLGT